MLCTACTSAVVGSAAGEMSVYAEALKNMDLPLLVQAALIFSVVEPSVKFYLMQR